MFDVSVKFTGLSFQDEKTEDLSRSFNTPTFDILAKYNRVCSMENEAGVMT
jgi:hypothetical protein